jgi:biopolymer transport protein TolR
MKKRRKRILPRAEINVTPFIDILLVLLVIFMTISPTMPTGMNAKIPQQPRPGPQSPAPETVIVVSMNRNGDIRINQTEVDISRLADELRSIFKTRSDRTIFVQASDELLFNDVAQLIDVVKGVGVERLGLMTEQITAR